MIKTIFFDFDGVLVESMGIKTRAFASIFRGYGPEIERAVVEYHINNGGISRYEKFRYYYRELLHLPLTDEELAALCERFAVLVKDAVVSAPYVPGALEFLKKYRDNCTFYITSATPQAELEEILLRRGVIDFFRSVFGAPTTKSEAVRLILDKANLTPSESLYIGDAMSDYEAAVENNVTFVARTCDNELFQGLSCLRIPDLSFLDAVVDSYCR